MTARIKRDAIVLLHFISFLSLGINPLKRELVEKYLFLKRGEEELNILSAEKIRYLKFYRSKIANLRRQIEEIEGLFPNSQFISFYQF